MYHLLSCIVDLAHSRYFSWLNVCGLCFLVRISADLRTKDDRGPATDADLKRIRLQTNINLLYKLYLTI